MTPESQQRILNALNGVLADLEDWLKRLGQSEDRLGPIYDSVMQENGLAARLVVDLAAVVFPLSSKVNIKPHSFAEQKSRLRSAEFAALLLEQPEPKPDELAEFEKGAKDALPNLRQHFFGAAKAGPRYKRGGRPTELADVETRERIRAEIKMLRKPGTKLRDIYSRLALKYAVSPRTIRRIREEETNRID